MAESLSSLTTGLVTSTILIDGKAIKSSYAVISVRVFKGVNRIPIARIEIVDGGTTSADDFAVSSSKTFDPGKEIEIRAGYDANDKAIFKGVIVKHSLRINEGESKLVIECRDKAVGMTIGRKNAVYLDKKDSDIISEIVNNYSLSKKIDATKFTHSEVVQHYSTDWDFVVMRADVNGLIVLANDNELTITAPNLSGSPVVTANYGSDIISFNGDIDARTQLASVEGISWDMSKQEIAKSTSNSAKEVSQGNLKSSALAKLVGPKTFTLQSAANVPLGVLDAWTSARHLKANLSKVKATVKFAGVSTVKPGDIIELGGLSPQFNGKAFVGAIEHVLEAGLWVLEVQIGVSSSWYIDETPDVVAPPASGLLPPIKGLQTALVTQIHEDAEGQYRVKVSLPTLQKDNMTLWARLTNFYSTADAGVFFYPEIGDEVIVGFLNEDPQNAIILGSVYSSKKKPVYTPDKDNFIKALVTKGLLKIEFDDEKKIITIATPGENTIVLDDDQKTITIQDSNKNIIKTSDKGIDMESPKDVNIKVKGKFVLDATGNVEIKSKGDVVGEGMNVSLKGKTKFAAEGPMAELKGSAQTVVKGGIVMIN